MLGPKSGNIYWVMPGGGGSMGAGNPVWPKGKPPKCEDTLWYNPNPTTVAGQVFDFDLFNLDKPLMPRCPAFEEECLHSTGTPDSMKYDLDGYWYNNCFIFSDKDKTPGQVKATKQP